MHVYTSLLPRSVQDSLPADEEFLRGQVLTLHEILKKNTSKSIASHHFRNLHTFFKFKYTFDEPKILFELIDLLVEYVFTFKPTMEMQTKALDAIVLLIKKTRKLHGENPTLQWNAPLEIWDCLFYQNPSPILPVSNPTLTQYKASLIKYMAKARKSYPSDGAIWAAVAPFIEETEKETSLKAVAILSLLWTPTVNATPLLDTWMKIWGRINTLQEWDLHWLRLLSRVAKHQQVNNAFDAQAWSKHLPFIFAKIQNCMALPSDMGPSPARGKWPKNLQGLHSEKHALYYASKLVVYLLSPTTTTQSLVVQLLNLLSPFFHPSSAGNAASGISDLIYYMSAFICLRSGEEKAKNGQLSFESALIVQELLDLAFLGIYAKNQAVSSKASFTLRNIIVLSHEFAPLIVEKLLRGLDPTALSQTHQAPSVISALTICGPALLRGDLSWVANLPSILHLTLPGIDPNDDGKTSRTLQLYSSWLMYLPLADDTSKPMQPRSDLAKEWLGTLQKRLFSTISLSPDIDETLWRMGPSIESWVLQLLDRMFVIFRQQERPESSASKNEDKFQIASHLQHVVHLLFVQLSRDIYTRALNRVADFIASTYLPSAGKLVAGFVAAVTSPDPERALPKLLLPACETILKSKNLSDNETCWQLRIIDGTVRSTNGSALLPYHQKLKEVVAVSSAHSSPKVVKLACKIIRHVLNRLTATYQPDYGRSLPPQAFELSQASGVYQFIGSSLSWGALNTVWYEPSTNELLMAADWLQSFVVEHIPLLSSGVSIKARTPLRHILHAIRGAKYVLFDELIESPPSNVSPMLYQPQLLLQQSLKDHPAALSLFLGLRIQVGRLCEKVADIWYDSTEVLASKCLRYTLRILQLILHTRDTAHAGNIRMYAKWRKLSSGDIASKTMTKLVPTTAESIPLMPRRMMQERIAILLSEHLDDRSFLHSRMWRTKSELFKEAPIFPLLLDVMARLSIHNLAKIRAAAQSSMDQVLKRYGNWHSQQLPVWIAALESGDHHVVTGYLHLLQLSRTLRLIWKDWNVMEQLLRMLCRCADRKNMSPEDEMKTSARVLKVFLQVLAATRDSSSIPSIDGLIAMEEEMRSHWRFQLMHLACFLPWIRSDMPIPQALWQLVLNRVVSDVPQVANFGRLLLSRLLKVHHANPQRQPLDLATLESLFASNTLKALSREMVLNHRTATRSADGQSADVSPARWSLGVSELMNFAEQESFDTPLRAFGQKSADNISRHHIALVERLALEAQASSIDLFNLWRPILEELTECQTEERRASISTVGEVLVGLSIDASVLMPLYKSILPKLSVPYANDWHDIVFLATQSNALLEYVVVEMEASFAASDSVDASGQVRWLTLSQAVAVNLVHQKPTEQSLNLITRIIHVISQNLDHPYEFVREQVAGLLYIMTDAISRGFSAIATPLPSVVFNAEVVDEKEICLRKTILSWIAMFVHKGDSEHFQHILPLFAFAFDTQAYPDADVARSARIIVESVANKLRLFGNPNTIIELMKSLENAAKSPLWRTRGAVLRFLTVFNFHHGLLSAFKKEIERIIVTCLNDEVRDVQDLAQYSLRGFVRTLELEEVTRLSSSFLSSAQSARLERSKLERQIKRCRLLLRVKKEGTDIEAVTAKLEDLLKLDTSSRNAITAQACFGMGAIVLAYPYSVPAFIPALIEELSLHLHVNGTISYLQDVVKSVLLEFKRTHQDSWHEDKLVFSPSQLEAIEDLLISPHYYS